jgi:uncharacterized membrane protein
MKKIRIIVTVIMFILLCAVLLRDGGVSFFSGLGNWVVYLLILFVLITGIINILIRKKNKYSFTSAFFALALILMILRDNIFEEPAAWLNYLIYAVFIAAIIAGTIVWSKKDSPEKKD